MATTQKKKLANKIKRLEARLKKLKQPKKKPDPKTEFLTDKEIKIVNLEKCLPRITGEEKTKAASLVDTFNRKGFLSDAQWRLVSLLEARWHREYHWSPTVAQKGEISPLDKSQ